MSSIRLTRREAREGLLPRVCMVCGERASGTRSKVMNWHPPWVYVLLLVGLLPFIIVALITQKRMRLEAPLCPRHQNHWSGRTLIILLSFVGLLVAAFGLMMIGSQRGGGASFGVVCFGLFGFGLAWLVLAIVLSLTAIRPQEITDEDMTLAGVSDEFIDAMDDYLEEERPRRRSRRREDYDEEDDRPLPRRREEYDDEEERPSPRRRKEHEDEEDRPPPRRRRPPPDAYEERD